MEQNRKANIKWAYKTEKRRSEIIHNSYIGDKYEETRKLIQKIIDKWCEPLLLNSWRTFTIHFDYQYKQGSMEVVADCSTNWMYMIADITFYLPPCVDRTEEELTHTLIHEVMHAYLDELTSANGKEDSENHEEHVCTLLAIIIRKVRNAAAEGKLNAETVKEKTDSGSDTTEGSN